MNINRKTFYINNWIYYNNWKKVINNCYKIKDEVYGYGVTINCRNEKKNDLSSHNLKYKVVIRQITDISIFILFILIILYTVITYHHN